MSIKNLERVNLPIDIHCNTLYANEIIEPGSKIHIAVFQQGESAALLNGSSWVLLPLNNSSVVSTNTTLLQNLSGTLKYYGTETRTFKVSYNLSGEFLTQDLDFRSIIVKNKVNPPAVPTNQEEINSITYDHFKQNSLQHHTCTAVVVLNQGDEIDLGFFALTANLRVFGISITMIEL